MVGVLLLLYSGVALITVRQEKEANTALDRMMENEGRYYAELSERQSVEE